MRKNIFVDLNVIMDVLLQRGDTESARDVLRLGESDTHLLHLSAHSVTTFAYLLEREKIPHHEQVRQLHWLLHTFQIAATDDTLLVRALSSDIRDYEDAVVEAAASRCRADAIITGNIKGFVHSSVPAFTPKEYLQKN